MQEAAAGVRLYEGKHKVVLYERKRRTGSLINFEIGSRLADPTEMFQVL
jgi:NADPH-dependent glutamate synthase beta subunit-like oxidoreductase